MIKTEQESQRLIVLGRDVAKNIRAYARLHDDIGRVEFDLEKCLALTVFSDSIEDEVNANVSTYGNLNDLILNFPDPTFCDDKKFLSTILNCLVFIPISNFSWVNNNKLPRSALGLAYLETVFPNVHVEKMHYRNNATRFRLVGRNYIHK